MTLSTVADYVRRARVLLLDEVHTYRYPDVDLVDGLNESLLEMRRLRPDLMLSYFRTGVPEYSVSDMAATVAVDEQYRTAVVYYICAMAQLRDEENTQDSRAAAFMQKFSSVMNASIM